jgi:hypothetical protein
MSDPLKSRITAAAQRLDAPAPAFTSVRSRGRRRLWYRRIGAAGTALVVGIAAFAAFQLGDDGPTDPIATESRGYVFAVEILDYKPELNHAVVRYRQEWAHNSFPGTRVCTWHFYDDDGSVLTEFDQKFTSLPRVVTHTKEITVPQEPAEATVTCGRRLDAGHFRILATKIVRVDNPDYRDEWRLRYLAEWVGSEHGGTELCSYRVFAANNNLIARGRFSLTVIDPKARWRFQTLRYRKTHPRPLVATMRCGPIRGG